MSKVLIVNNTPYQYPTSGDEPGWGGDATGWAEGVTQVLSDLFGPNDILETSFSISNNQQPDKVDIIGLNFNVASVRSAIIDYSIFRISSANPSGFAETGTIKIVYDNTIGQWSSGQGAVIGDSQVILSITPTGQFQYTSNDIGALNYTGTIKFRAKALQQ